MILSRFTRRTGGEVDDKQLTCTIRFLDDSEPIILAYQRDAIGKQLFDQVCESLDLLEKDYFGLRFVDLEKQRHWLDLTKPIYRQLKHVKPAVLCFRVKFYPSDPTKLREEITRYFLFLQLRRDLHHGRLLCEPSDANILSAYIIQSELGDYDPEEHLVDYVNKFKMLPKQTQKQEEKIAELHRSLAGQVPAEAEMNFLRRATVLDTYGVDPHPVKDTTGNQMYLGITHLGIVTFQGSKRTHLFGWHQITKITYEGKVFIAHVTISENEENYILIRKRGRGSPNSFNPPPKKHAVGYKCPTPAACKHLWKCAVEQRYFFTLLSTTDAPKVTSGGGLFNRGTKFRFSGRCEREAYNDFSLERDEPPRFSRTSSNPQFAQRYSSLRSGSVPSTFNALGLSDESLDSLTNGGESHWRSLDDFSRVSTPRGRPMELADHMIPEESPGDITRSPSAKQDPTRQRFFPDDLAGGGGGYSAPSTTTHTPLNGHRSTVGGADGFRRRRLLQRDGNDGDYRAHANAVSRRLEKTASIDVTSDESPSSSTPNSRLAAENCPSTGNSQTSNGGTKEVTSPPAMVKSPRICGTVFCYALVFTAVLLTFVIGLFVVFLRDSSGVGIDGVTIISSSSPLTGNFQGSEGER